MFALVVRFDCRDEAAVRQFDDLTAAAVRQVTEREPGTLIYATHAVEGDPLARVFYEVYADREAFEEHERAEHVREFHARKDPLLTGTRVEFLAPGAMKALSESVDNLAKRREFAEWLKNGGLPDLTGPSTGAKQHDTE